MLTAVARSAAIDLADFERLFEANGFSEVEIHTIIPDRSGPDAACALGSFRIAGARCAAEAPIPAAVGWRSPIAWIRIHEPSVAVAVGVFM